MHACWLGPPVEVKLTIILNDSELNYFQQKCELQWAVLTGFFVSIYIKVVFQFVFLYLEAEQLCFTANKYVLERRLSI